MASLSETQQALQSRGQQVAEAERQIQSFNPNIERTQRMLRQAPAGTSLLNQQARLREAERLRGVAKSEALGQVEGFKTEQTQLEQQYQDYLQSDTGKLQYVQESGVQPTETLYAGKGDDKYIEGYRYNTPYGTVIDYSPSQQQAKFEVRSAGFKNVDSYIEDLAKRGQVIKSIQEKSIINERGQVNLPDLEVNQLMSIPKRLPSVGGMSLGRTSKDLISTKTTTNNVPGFNLDSNQLSPNSSNSPIGKFDQGQREFGRQLKTLFTPTKVEPKFSTAEEFMKSPEYQNIITGQKFYGSTTPSGRSLSMSSKASTFDKLLSPNIRRELTIEGIGVGAAVLPGVGTAFGLYQGGKGGINIAKSGFDPYVIGKELPNVLLGAATTAPDVIRGVRYLKQPVQYSAPVGFKDSKMNLKLFDTNRETLGYIGNVKTTTPDVIMVSTTKARELFGRPPQSVRIVPGNVYNTPVSGVVNRELGVSKGIFATRLEGPYSKIARPGEVTGLTTETTIPLKNALPSQRFVSRKFFEEFDPSISPEETPSTFYTGEASVRTGIGTPNNPNIRLTKFGGGKKEIFVANRPALVSEVQKPFSLIEVRPVQYRTVKVGGMDVGVKLPEGSEFFNIKAATKTSTSLSPRARGDVDYLTGQVQVVKVETPTDLSSNIIGRSTRTVSKQQVNQLAAKASQQAASSVPKPKISLPKPVSAKPLSSYITAPTMVGGLGKGTSAFYARGSMSDSETLAPRLSRNIGITGRSITDLSISTGVTPSFRSNLSSGLSSNFRQSAPTSSREEEKLKTPTAFIEIPKQNARGEFGLGERQSSAQLQSLSQAQAQQTRLRVDSPTIPLDSIRTEPPRIKNPFKVKKSSDKLPKVGRRRLSKVPRFIPELRRRGKFLEIGKPTSDIREAFSIGVRRARETLGASLRIKEESSGRIVDLGRLGAAGFAPSKRSASILVQQRGFRLGSLGERREIQQSRRRKNNLFGI